MMKIKYLSIVMTWGLLGLAVGLVYLLTLAPSAVSAAPSDTWAICPAGRLDCAYSVIQNTVKTTNDGELDHTFGAGGIATTSVTENDRGRAVIIQTDGKIVVAGGKTIVRYTPTGTLDPSFGTGGAVTAPSINDAYIDLNAAVLQSDHKIVVAGSSNNEVVLVRYGTDGSLDTDFGAGGVVTTSIGTSSHIFDLALQTDGKLVAAGTSRTNWNNDILVARYTASGDLDFDFASTGFFTIPLNFSMDYGNAVAIQPDGKIVVAGSGHWVRWVGMAQHRTYRILKMSCRDKAVCRMPRATAGTCLVVK